MFGTQLKEFGMTRELTTGAEEIFLPGTWDTIVANDNIVQTNGDLLTTKMQPRTGYACYALAFQDLLGKTLNLSSASVYTGFAFGCTSLSSVQSVSLFTVNTSTGSLSIRLLATGALRVLRGAVNIGESAGGVISQSTWHHIQVYCFIDDSAGRVQIYVDGASVINFTGDTNSATTVNVYTVTYQGVASAGRCCFDDIVINSSAGSVNNGLPGQVRLLPVQPRAAGDLSQLTRAGVDLGNNFAQVRAPGNEFSMLQTNTTNNADLYLTDIPDLPADAVITNVIVKARLRVQLGTRNGALLIKSGGTQEQGSDFALSAGWRWYEHVAAVNPADSGAWAEADLNGLQIGVKAR